MRHDAASTKPSTSEIRLRGASTQGNLRMKVETAERRETLTRQRVLEAAVELADRHGIESVSMRRLGQELGVEAMSLHPRTEQK